MKLPVLVTSTVSRWNQFWFEPQATSSLALFRIAFGLVTVCWTVSLIPNALTFYGPDGILPSPPTRQPYEWSLLFWFSDPIVVIAVVALTLVAAIAVTIGAFTRTASVVLAIGMMCLEQRNTFTMNAGDSVIRAFAFLLVLTPAGVALSVDRFRKARERFWEFPARAPWGLRLIQIQMSVGYLAAVWQKSGGETWRDESAVSDALRMEDIARLPTPEFITQSATLTGALTLGTLFIEFSLGVLVWNRTLRPWVLIFGVLFHLGINWSIMVGFFSWVMIASYASFVPPETATRWVLAVRDAAANLKPSGSAGSASTASAGSSTAHVDHDGVRVEGGAKASEGILHSVKKFERRSKNST
jgi:hypothetical protein